MRTTRAYIASAGTAGVMLAASVAALLVVSAFVAFGSWPGEKTAKQVDQVLLNDVANPKPTAVAVRADAISVARRVELHKAVQTRKVASRQGSGPARAVLPGARTPGGSRPGATVPNTGGGTVTPAAG